MSHDEHSAPFALGRYELVSKIASGGMATVYRGRKSGRGGFEREFAVKVVHPHLSAVEGFTERFLDEARVASRVHHPNVCAVIDIDADRGYQFLVLELIDGVTLRQSQVWGDGAPFDPEEAARIVADTAHGLEALHGVTDEHGEPLDVVHRDLSPHNLMIDATGRTVLIDLGLAEARDKLGHTQTGVLCGKLPYMSPEQSLMDPLDHRSDLFSLGTVLFELVTGELPFGEDHTPGTLERLRTCDTASLEHRLEAHGVPGWLRDIIARCLQLDPEARYGRAQDLAQALEAEMHLRGFEQSDIRARVAVRVRQTQAAIGEEEPAAPLPEPIHVADETPRSGRSLASGVVVATGPHRATRPWRAPAWIGGSVLAAVALVGIASAFDLTGSLIGTGRPGEMISDDPSLGALERARDDDGVNRTARPEESESVSTAPRRPRAESDDGSTSDGEELPVAEASTTAAPEPPPRRRSSRRRRTADAPKLRKNPYTN